jgi:hypothetical protein
MFKTPPKKKDKPPEGENRQDGDTNDKAEGLQSNQFTINSLRARKVEVSRKCTGFHINTGHRTI